MSFDEWTSSQNRHYINDNILLASDTFWNTDHIRVIDQVSDSVCSINIYPSIFNHFPVIQA